MRSQRLPAPHWRVFYTHPRAEKKVERLLHDKGIEAFLPKRVVVRQWKDRKKKVIEPLLRNYIFAHVNEADRIRVLQSAGVAYCVAFGSGPVVVPQEEIDQLKLMQKDPTRIAPTDAPLPPNGTEITVEQGPFRGLKGEVIQHRQGVYLVVRIASVRQAVRVQLPVADCVPAP